MNEFTPRRVVCLQPSATSTLESLGLIDRVVACTRHCSLVAPSVNTGNVTVVEDSWTAQTDQILRANPDLVLASVPYQAEAVAQILAAGVRTLALAPRTLADVYADIVTIANIMGAAERGGELVTRMQQEVQSIRRQTSGCRRVRVFCEEWGKPIMISQPWVAELVEAAGGTFIGEPGRTMLPETVREAAPEVLVFAWCGAGNRVPIERLVSDRCWQNVPAVADGRVYVISDEFLTTPGPPLRTGLLALAHAIQPLVFPSEPQNAGTKIMRRLGEPVFK